MPDLVTDPIEAAERRVEQDRAAQVGGSRAGRPAIYVCPDCGGTLWQVDEPEILQFRCHVGHVVRGEALLQAQSQAAEDALWTAIRTLTDKMILARELATAARRRGEETAAEVYDAQASIAEQTSQRLREVAELPVRPEK